MNKYKNKYKISIQLAASEKRLPAIFAEPGANLLDLLRQHNVWMQAPCGGNGICGKCRVQILQGAVPVTEEERRILTEQELRCGLRLACWVSVSGDMVIRIGGQAAELDTSIQVSEHVQAGAPDHYDYVIAADLGSTTLAAALLDADGMVLVQASAPNSQRAYGADIISRMQAANTSTEKREALRTCICMDLTRLFQILLAGREGIRIRRIAIAGNTAMLHLLRGYSCEKLAQAPFQPVNLKLECLDYTELFSETFELKPCMDSIVYLLPGLAAFIGADITAGLYSSGFLQTPDHELAVFLDLGTNGEMAAGNGAGFVTASTASGPALEGGRLSCGVPGIPGAVSKVSYLYNRIRVQTIGQKKPCGICGTGALDAVAALRKEGLLDADGLLVPELFDTGFILSERADGSKIRLTQGDVREIQLAKAAVRAGLETLLLRYREMHPEIDKSPLHAGIRHIYLAGGLGCYLSPETAAVTGLLPMEWKGLVTACGNTSLKGAAAFLTDSACRTVMAGLSDKNREIQLADDPYFQERYVQEMRFPCLLKR